MVRRLPPLNALRAFEAAARHRSFSAAARELSVTHSAISRHVSKLEAHLDAPLFLRDPQGLSLTAEGKAYAARVSHTFDLIQEATTQNFFLAPERRALRIGVYPTFANQVLIPRLAQFRERFPDIPFQIETSLTPLASNNLPIDVAVVLGTGSWPDLVAEHLFDEELLPVGSPKLLCGRRLRSSRDFDEFTLLHAVPRLHDWAYCLKSAGIDSVDAHRGMHFEHSGMAYQAAANGLGLAIAQKAYVRDELQRDRLAPCFDAPCKTEQSFYLVYAPAKSDDPRVIAFAQWLHGEMRDGQ
jgi:LysR family glycine cleavage system transcriptional activator